MARVGRVAPPLTGVGGLVELDDRGTRIRGASAARRLDPDPHPCSLTLVVLTQLDGIPVATLARSFPWSAVAGEDTDCNVPVRFGRFWIQPVATTGSVVALDESTPDKPVIVAELPFGIDARPHWLALEPGGRRIVMTGGGTLAGGVYLIDVNPETGTLTLAGDLPASGSRIPGIRFDRDAWPHGQTGPAFAHGAVFSSVK